MSNTGVGNDLISGKSRSLDVILALEYLNESGDWLINIFAPDFMLTYILYESP